MTATHTIAPLGDTAPEPAADLDGSPDRAQLRRLIAGLTDGIVLVEPDGRLAWANDAALRMHRAADLDALGRDARAYAERHTLSWRTGRALTPDEQPIARLLRGEVFDGLVVAVSPRGAPDAVCIQRVRGLALDDARGRPDCLALVLEDATEAFEAEERFERMFNANPAPALIVRVSDLRYVRVNEGFLELSGRRREDVIGRSLYELDILEGVPQRDIARARLTDWRPVHQVEAELTLAGGGSTLVIVAGSPVEIGDARCMIFTFADLEPRRRAETALRQSEERFAKSFRLAPVPMKLTTLDGHRILNVNHAFLELTGWSYEEVIGRKPGDIELWESAAVRREVERRLVEGGGFRGCELKLKTKAGEMVDCLFSAETVTMDGEPRVLAAFQDISARKRTEAELVAAIEATMQDSRWISERIMDKLAAVRSPAGLAGDAAALTGREREVLDLIARGRGDAAIAQALSLSRNTVRNHVARLYGKIGAHSRAEAIVWARDRGHSLNAPPRE